VLSRTLFALLAVAAVLQLMTGPPAGFDESDTLRRTLLLCELLFVAAGMIVSWGRALSGLRSPGWMLGFVSKLLGWLGAGTLPSAVVFQAWSLLVPCVALPWAAWALWTNRAWAAWPWYAVALASFACCAVVVEHAFGVFADGARADVSHATVEVVGSVLCLALFGAVGVRLFRELGAWRRSGRPVN